MRNWHVALFSHENTKNQFDYHRMIVSFWIWVEALAHWIVNSLYLLYECVTLFPLHLKLLQMDLFSEMAPLPNMVDISSGIISIWHTFVQCLLPTSPYSSIQNEELVVFFLNISFWSNFFLFSLTKTYSNSLENYATSQKSRMSQYW